MTEQEIKDNLPTIRVLLPGGTIVNGQLAGRLNRFATVFVPMHGTHANFEVAWPTVVNLINTDRPLHI